MALNLEFDPEVFLSLVGGRSVLEAPRLNLQSRDEAIAYLKAYGYDVHQEPDRERIWAIHSRAVTYIRTQLLYDGENIPEEVADPNKLGDITKLLLWASHRDTSPDSLRRWSCALLRVMHVISQLQNDLFNYFSAEIQDEIFRPYRQFLQNDPVLGIKLAGPQDEESIALKKFDVKPFKDSDSSITKLLAKPEEVAFGLMDRIGVRFVTSSLFDVFRVMRFLLAHHVVSPAHLIPSQSNNTLYPTQLFLSVMEGLPKRAEMKPAELDELLKERLAHAADRAQYLEKANVFTSKDYRFVKFITRQMVRVTLPESQRSFSFVYPYEVQVIDYDHYIKTMTGPASHSEYKTRQRNRARERVLGPM